MGILEGLFKNNGAPARTVLEAEVSSHFEKWFGPEDGRNRDLPNAPGAFIEVRDIPPSDRFPFRVIHTVGMASRRMKTNAKGQEPFAELMMVLPTEWSYGTDPEWPVREMRRFARMFHEMSACLTEFIVIPFEAKSEPGTPFAGLMAVRPQFVPPAAHRVELSTGQTVHLYCLMPLHLVEMKYASTQPEPEALWRLGRSQKRDPLEMLVVDVRRPPVA